MKLLLFLTAITAVVSLGKKDDLNSFIGSLWNNGTAITQLTSGDFSIVQEALQHLLGTDFDATVNEMEEIHMLQRPHGKGDLKLLKSSKAPLKKSRDSSATPVVQMHGMGDWANDPFGMVPLAKDISDYLGGAYVLNVQIGENSIADILNGFIMNLDDQVDYFAKVVQGDANLVNGFNAIGYSQGNLVIRGYIERYNSPPVFNFISMHGPLAGVSGFPGCSLDKNLCKVFAEALGALAYYPKIQDHLAQANYFRDPMKIDSYKEKARFLPDINNEDSSIASEYSGKFTSLQSLVLVKALGDTVVIPNDSEWFGSFADGSLDTIWSFQETPWYKSDLFGLQTLDKKGSVYFYTTEGDHLDFDTDFLLDLVGQYFV